MKQVTSTEFQKLYPRLQETTEVLAHGRVIGRWTPVNVMVDDRVLAGSRPGEPSSTEPAEARPFTPAPKPSQRRKR